MLMTYSPLAAVAFVGISAALVLYGLRRTSTARDAPPIRDHERLIP